MMDFIITKKILREGESTTQLCTGFLIDHARVEKKILETVE